MFNAWSRNIRANPADRQKYICLKKKIVRQRQTEKGIFFFFGNWHFSTDFPSKQIMAYLSTESGKIITNILNDHIERWIWNIRCSQ